MSLPPPPHPPPAQVPVASWIPPPANHARVIFHERIWVAGEVQPPKAASYKTTYIPLVEASRLKNFLKFIIGNGINSDSDLKDLVGVSNKGYRYTFLPFDGVWEEHWAATTFTDVCVVYEKLLDGSRKVVIALFCPKNIPRTNPQAANIPVVQPPAAPPITTTAGNMAVNPPLGYGAPSSIGNALTAAGFHGIANALTGTAPLDASGGYPSVGSVVNAPYANNYMAHTAGMHMDFSNNQMRRPSIADPYILLNGGFAYGHEYGVPFHGQSASDFSQQTFGFPTLRSNATVDQYGNIIPLPDRGGGNGNEVVNIPTGYGQPVLTQNHPNMNQAPSGVPGRGGSGDGGSNGYGGIPQFNNGDMA